MSNATNRPWHNNSTNHGYGPRHVCGPLHKDGSDYAPICIANTEEDRPTKEGKRFADGDIGEMVVQTKAALSSGKGRVFDADSEYPND